MEWLGGRKARLGRPSPATRAPSFDALSDDQMTTLHVSVDRLMSRWADDGIKQRNPSRQTEIGSLRLGHVRCSTVDRAPLKIPPSRDQEPVQQLQYLHTTLQPCQQTPHHNVDRDIRPHLRWQTHNCRIPGPTPWISPATSANPLPTPTTVSVPELVILQLALVIVIWFRSPRTTPPVGNRPTRDPGPQLPRCRWPARIRDEAVA